ncbi:hypothetical protein SAY86_007482 [Trapa natans]|uniref:C3H1-type domain-containing protein n=1 Tax=Trapa natans TaxID=22666 RepID=A0AAN7R270_TRANT|nr:hypothetical protein SAY86_007482 [Trapa natans]
MDHGQQSGNVVHVISGLWASEEEYCAWNNADKWVDTPSHSNHDKRQSQMGSEPPNEKSKSVILDSATSGNSRSKAIWKMFFKTKLCCKFRTGTCPYITNCNFAHSVEELRRPPPNWQEIVAAAHEEEREEFQIPSIGSSGFTGESQRSYKGRHCKKFYTEEGCPYGDSCTFLHDEQSKNRESVAISLGPGGYSGGGGDGGGTTLNGGNEGGAVLNLKPSNWKTRICNKWELTGYCPFGSKCHFAHGNAELHKYGGGLVDSESRDSSSVPPNEKQGAGVTAKAPLDIVFTTVNSVPHSDVYYMGVTSQRPASTVQRTGQRALQKWKGPNKISRIYGDWIDDVH